MKITCIVDNNALEGTDLLHEHGLSLLIETNQGNVLFDTGRTEEVFSHNYHSLGCDDKKITALALSHAHHDHTAGIGLLLDRNDHPKFFANPDFFTLRYAFRNNEYQSIGMKFPRELILSRADVTLSEQPTEIVPGLWTSGVIQQREFPLGDNKDHVVQDGDQWIPDPYLDDMSLVQDTESGLIVICGCCHAGILNTLYHVRNTFQKPIRTVIGGIHLMSADRIKIDQVSRMIHQDFANMTLHVNHCTGEEAFKMLRTAHPEKVLLFPAGQSLQFD